jgi:hypothetical protein
MESENVDIVTEHSGNFDPDDDMPVASLKNLYVSASQKIIKMSWNN